MKNKSRAFSLIELSIVILIIGILIAGITQASRLVRESKLKTAQTLTKSSPVAGIPGLALWLEPTLDESFAIAGGADQAEEGAIVNQWNDINPQSSSKYFMNNDTSAVTYSSSAGAYGLPSVRFDADGALNLSNDTFANSGTDVGLPIKYLTYFIVYQTADSGANVEVENDSDATGYTVRYDHTTSARSFEYPQGAGSLQTTGGPTPSVAEIVSITLDSTSSNMYVNGVNAASISGLASATSSGSSDGIFQLNNNGSEAENFSELIIFDRALKNEERQSVEEYLGKKYGIKVVKNTSAEAPGSSS